MQGVLPIYIQMIQIHAHTLTYILIIAFNNNDKWDKNLLTQTP